METLLCQVKAALQGGGITMLLMSLRFLYRCVFTASLLIVLKGGTVKSVMAGQLSCQTKQSCAPQTVALHTGAGAKRAPSLPGAPSPLCLGLHQPLVLGWEQSCSPQCQLTRAARKAEGTSSLRKRAQRGEEAGGGRG